ncbi:MAG: IS5/IS1182 family transposase, partial [Sphaerospermopsis kisseleviana]
LMEVAKLTHQEQKALLEKNKRRVNAAGGGRKPKLKIEEEICLTLFYCQYGFPLELVLIKIIE